MRKFIALYAFIPVVAASCKRDKYDFSVSENREHSIKVANTLPVKRQLHLRFEVDDKEYFNYVYNFNFDKVRIDNEVFFVPSLVNCSKGKVSGFYTESKPSELKIFKENGQFCFEIPVFIAFSKSNEIPVNEKTYPPFQAIYQSLQNFSEHDTICINKAEENKIAVQNFMSLSRTFRFKCAGDRMIVEQVGETKDIEGLEKEFGSKKFRFSVTSDLLNEIYSSDTLKIVPRVQ